MKSFKTLTKTLTALALALAVGVLPAFAADAPADAASDSIAVSEVKKFTPAVDGVIDPEYLDSFNIAHTWDADSCFGDGKFDIDENGETAYGWDCQATSYFLWDDEYLYITVDVTDDDYGCIDDEHYDILYNDNDTGEEAGPVQQDSVRLHLQFKDRSSFVIATRDGKHLYNWITREADEKVLCDLVIWKQAMSGEEDPSEYVVKETENGYVAEIALRIDDSVKGEFLKNQSSLSYTITAVDAASGSPYVPLQDLFMDAGYHPGDSWFFEDVIWLFACYGGDPQNRDLTLTLSDEAPVAPDVPDVPDVPDILDVPDVPALDTRDVNGDGTVDSKDLTRLMKHLAGEEVELAIADINGDGATDTKDLTRLMKQLAG